MTKHFHFLICFTTITVLLSHLALATDPIDFARWQAIDDIHQKQYVYPDSIRFAFVTVNEQIKNNEVVVRWTNTVTYERRKEEEAWNASIECWKAAAGSQGASVSTSSTIQTYDGRTSWLKERPGMIYQSQKPSLTPPPTPLPWTNVNLQQQEDIRSELNSGQVVIKSSDQVTYQGTDALLVHMVSARSGKPSVDIWYDREAAFIPIRTKSYDDNGDLVVDIYDVKVSSVEAHGNKYWFPVSGKRKIFIRGALAAMRQFDVNISTLKVDCDIPSEDFIIPRTPQDSIYNFDIQRIVYDAAGGLPKDLGDISDNPALSPAIQAAAAVKAVGVIDKYSDQANINFGLRKYLFVTAGTAVLIFCIVWHLRSRTRRVDHLTDQQ